MTTEEITEAHRDHLAACCAGMVGDIIRQRNHTHDAWREAVSLGYTDDLAFRRRMGSLTEHIDRLIGEATAAASCRWVDGSYCEMLPVTQDFARTFRERVFKSAISAASKEG